MRKRKIGWVWERNFWGFFVIIMYNVYHVMFDKKPCKSFAISVFFYVEFLDVPICNRMEILKTRFDFPLSSEKEKDAKIKK